MTTSDTNIIKKTHLRYTLEEKKYLHQDEITTLYVMKSSKNQEPIKTSVERIESFPLREVTVEQLKMIRAAKIPGFVLKENDTLYFAKINEDVHIMSENILGKHRCAIPGEECRRLSAAKDEDGGCAKVRNCATYIERYPWITLGYETFCTRQNALVVIDCNHYKCIQPRAKLSSSEIASLKISIAKNIDPDIKTLKDVRNLHSKNLSKGKKK